MCTIDFVSFVSVPTGHWPCLKLKFICLCAEHKFSCVSDCLCVCVFHLNMDVFRLVLASAWVGCWSLGRSPVFLRPLPDVAFLKTAGRGVAEHLDEAQALPLGDQHGSVTQRWTGFTPAFSLFESLGGHPELSSITMCLLLGHQNGLVTWCAPQSQIPKTSKEVIFVEQLSRIDVV